MASYLPNDVPGCFLHLSAKKYTHSYGRLHQDALVWINDGNIVLFVDCNGHKHLFQRHTSILAMLLDVYKNLFHLPHKGCRNIDKAQTMEHTH